MMGLGEQAGDGLDDGYGRRPASSKGSPSYVHGELAGALGDGVEIVVCDLSTSAVAASDVVEMFDPVIAYLSDWPAAGVVVVCSRDSEAWAALASTPHPDTLVLCESADEGVQQLRPLLPTVDHKRLHLSRQLTSPRVSRLFVTRSLLDWQLVPLVASASLVVSELVTNAIVHAASTVDITLSRADGRIQMMVRDRGTGHPTARFDDPRDQFLGGRGLLLVEEATRGWGVFPATPGGKTVWTVFDARPQPACGQA